MKISLALCALMASVSFVGAQEVNKLEEYVTTGTLAQTLTEDIPAAVEVITSEEIEKMAATDVREVLRRAASIQTQAQKGGINIRGFGANYTIVLINGRRVSGLDAAKDSQSIALESIDVNNIEKVEILRGQAGAIYGSNAIGGVINIITKKSQEESSMFYVTGSNESIKIGGLFDTGKVGNFDMIVGMSATELYGIESDIYPTGTSKSKGDRINLTFDAGYELAPNHEIRWLGNYLHDDARTTNRGITSGGNIVDTETPSENRKIGTDIVYLGSNESANWNTGITYGQTQRYIYENSATPFSASKIERFEYYGIDGKYSTSLNDWNLLTVGGELVNETTNQDVALFGDNLAHVSVFAQDEISLIDGSLYIVPLVRFDHYFDSFGSDITPSIGLTYSINDDHRIKTSVGLGYKAPTITELYGRETRGTGGTGILSAGRGTYVFGNPDLQPEKSVNFDIRYEGNFNENISGSLGYYYSDIEDKISSQFFRINPISELNDTFAVNIANAEVQGIEAALNVEFNEFVSMSLDYNYVDAMDKDANVRLTGSAEHQIGAGFDFEYGRVNASIWGEYNGNYLESLSSGDYEFNYYSTSASMNIQLTEKYKLSFGAYNFLTTNEDEFNTSSIDPAEYHITLTMKF